MMDDVKVKKQVAGMSGHCRFPTRDAGSHRTCHRAWETPSVWVMCECACHVTMGVEGRAKSRIVAKGQTAGSVAGRAMSGGRKIVAKK